MGSDNQLAHPDPQPPQPGRTLLPGPFAQAVSLATRSTCLAIKFGSAASYYGLGAARVTTLSSLEIARTLVEGVLSRAGRDTLARSGSELAAVDAENVIERSLENLHQAMTQVVFWTTAGFHFTSTTISVASDFSQLFLSSLDQLLGSTDSSRAIASIVTLIRREFRNPVTGSEGDRVGVMDLVLGLCAMSYLQQRCWRLPLEEERRQAYEEVIWDVVVLNDGERIDVQGRDIRSLRRSQSRSSLAPSDNANLSTMPKPSVGDLRNGFNDEEAIVQQLQADIVEALPPDTTVTISNSITTTQTITIDVDGPRPASLPTPPGAEVIEIGPRRPGSSLSQSHNDQGDSSYRVIYKFEKNKFGATSFRNPENPSRAPIVEIFSDTEALASPPRKELPREDAETTNSPPVNSQRSELKSPTPPSVANTKSSTRRPSRSSPRPPTVPPRNGVRTENETKASPSPSSRPLSAMSKQRTEREANQKKPRAPLATASSRNKTDVSRSGHEAVRTILPKRKSDSVLPRKNAEKGSEKRGGLKQALKEGSQSFSNIWHKDATTLDKSNTRRKDLEGKAGLLSSSSPTITKIGPTVLSTSPDELMTDPMEVFPRSSSRSSFVSNRERRDSTVSQNGRHSPFFTGHLRPSSSGHLWNDTGVDSSLVNHDGTSLRPVTPTQARSHRPLSAHIPSIYSLASNDSQQSLVLSSYYQKSPYTAVDALAILRREGAIDGIFPKTHVLKNITRYMRFSSASYGSNFLKLLGMSKQTPMLKAWDGQHSDVRHFLHHTASDTSSILLASIIDPQGGTDSSGSTGTGMPLVHYISLDHDAKAVVLACRGTLGFEDVLADMTCDYDTLTWRGRPYKVHKGVHASARRLLYGEDGRVLITLREALVEFPEYGVVLCGHSLGGAVTALLGVMLSEPNPHGTGFVTASEPQRPPPVGEGSARRLPAKPSLPAGRPIHVYAYGPPGTMSSTLRKLTRGLITTVVHGNDLVPYLSLGILHDFQAIALAFKQDQNQAKIEIRQRIWEGLQGGIADKWYHKAPKITPQDESEWGAPVLEAFRVNMTNQKLLPPGEVFAVEKQRVLRRDAFLLQDEDHIGRPAQRIMLKYIKDVEARFREVRFGASMLIDHSPAKYEEALDKLYSGVGV